MDSLLYKLKDDNTWLEYLEFKKNQISSTKKEIEYFNDYILNKKYENIVNNIMNGYKFSIPIKHLVNKINSDKKRVVYNFNEDENMVLKIISYLFSLKYDNKYSDNCYSFRKKNGPKEAINKLYNNINNLYGYKIDIKNYFNSIDINILFKKLDLFINDDSLLLNFIKDILSNPYVNFNNEIIKENKGIMAGIPISSFLANIYLKDLDDYFYNENILYIRYSDDIIIFTKENELDKYIKIINNKIKENNLLINENKVTYIKPNDKFDFLGFSFCDNKIDLSDISKQKIKSKIKRTCKKLRKWMIDNNTTYERAIKAVIRKFNIKFFSLSNTELTWQLWYFPVLTTIDSLHEIDLYFQDNLRYIKTGKHNKKNYDLKYETLKEYGYKSLVNEYYKFKKNM